jgi:hypothetical protein
MDGLWDVSFGLREMTTMFFDGEDKVPAIENTSSNKLVEPSDGSPTFVKNFAKLSLVAEKDKMLFPASDADGCMAMSCSFSLRSCSTGLDIGAGSSNFAHAGLDL